MKIDKNKLEEMCKHISSRELVASKAQRDSIKYKQVEYLQDKIGQVFDGIVSGVTDWGIYIELIESKCEGMVSYNTIGKVKVDLDNFTVTDTLGNKVRLGDSVKVIVNGVDLEKKQIDFKLF
jgi:ribonuclease R